ncbi:MAG: flagellin [Candidatus Rifleibacteriota bacterium]
MSLRVNHNVTAMRAYTDLAGVSGRLDKSVERLSSGLRITRAADDAAGLTISEKLRRQVRGLARATLNAQDGISMIQSAEGALNETHSILHRMRELAVQSANDTLTSNDRLEIQKEVIQLKNDLNRIAYNTEFNTKKLLDGSQSAIISTDSHFVKGLVKGPAMRGGDYSVSLALLEGGVAQMQRTQIFKQVGEADELAKGDTMLQSITQFYDGNGVFILDEPQILTLNGNNRSAEIVLDSFTTLDNLAAAIQNAIVDEIDGLDIKNSQVKVTNTALTSIAGDGGYLEILSGMIGEPGLISFAGNQQLIDAMGISTSRAAKDNFIEAALTDADGKTVVTQVDCDRVSGLLDGIDIQFASQPAQIASTRGLVQGLYFSASDSFTVNANGQSITLVISAGYRTLEGIARSINLQVTTAIGPASLKGLSASVIDGEIRLSFYPPASASSTFGTTIKITNAPEVSVLGFRNGTYTGFVDSQKSEDYLAWGFSKYMPGVASGEITAIEVSDGVGTVVINICTALGTAVGSATLADMVSFEAFKAFVNGQLGAATVAIRLDQVDNAMAFTSTRIGEEKISDYQTYSSIVSIKAVTVTGALVSATESLLDYFDLEAGSRSGRGNTNFRMHVKDVDPQYHIGANQMEVMKISMSDMSADALGVSKLDLTTVEGAERAMGKLNKAIDMVSSERSKLGAFQNRLEYTINNLRNMHGNAMASESRIRDADIASEMIEFTRNQVVNQSATAMLAQANSQASGILQLLQ